jgi:hypothetical protein
VLDSEMRRGRHVAILRRSEIATQRLGERRANMRDN